MKGRFWKTDAESINEAGASLIGPNCIGLMNMHYHGVFTQPIPEFHADGVDFISSSGGTALFIIESALTKDSVFLRFGLSVTPSRSEWKK